MTVQWGTHALRAVDVAAGIIPNINPHPLNELHPASEKPLGFDDAWQNYPNGVRLNWMLGPKVQQLIGASPAYFAVNPISASQRNLVPEGLKAKGYRAGEWYWWPITAHQAAMEIKLKEEDWPPVYKPEEFGAPVPTPELANKIAESETERFQPITNLEDALIGVKQPEEGHEVIVKMPGGFLVGIVRRITPMGYFFVGYGNDQFIVTRGLEESSGDYPIIVEDLGLPTSA